jgi:hypothetical protein
MHVQRGRGRARRSFGALGCFVVFLAASALGTAASATADLFDELFKQGQAKNGAMKTLTASFVETTSSTLLTKPLVSSGTLAVIRPSRIVLRYTQPDERVVLIDGDMMTIRGRPGTCANPRTSARPRSESRSTSSTARLTSCGATSPSPRAKRKTARALTW